MNTRIVTTELLITQNQLLPLATCPSCLGIQLKRRAPRSSSLCTCGRKRPCPTCCSTWFNGNYGRSVRQSGIYLWCPWRSLLDSKRYLSHFAPSRASGLWFAMLHSHTPIWVRGLNGHILQVLPHSRDWSTPLLLETTVSSTSLHRTRPFP